MCMRLLHFVMYHQVPDFFLCIHRLVRTKTNSDSMFLVGNKVPFMIICTVSECVYLTCRHTSVLDRYRDRQECVGQILRETGVHQTDTETGTGMREIPPPTSKQALQVVPSACEHRSRRECAVYKFALTYSHMGPRAKSHIGWRPCPRPITGLVWNAGLRQ